MKVIYETERLYIREWTNTDDQDMFEYASDENVTKFLCFPTHQSLQDAKDRIAYVKQQYQENPVVADYCIHHKATGKAIGAIGIVRYNEKNEGEAEVGYCLNPKFQGQGFMTEALLGMFKYIKQKQIAKRVILKHDVENVKSGNVMKRAGMKFEGVLRKAGANNYHKRHDLALYSILEEEI